MSYRRKQVLGALGRQATDLRVLAAELDLRHPAVAEELRRAATTVQAAHDNMKKETTP